MEFAAAMVTLWLLPFFLLTGVLSRPADQATLNPFTPKGCQIARFKSLSPRELEAFKRAKDAYEDSILQTVRNCSSRFFHRTWDLRQLPQTDRPIALKAELKLTLEVLRAIDNPDLEEVLAQPLQTLRHISQEIQNCVPHLHSKGRKLPGRLNHWLQRLREAKKKESQSCLEASVMLNLFRLLTQDLRCVAYGDLCR